MMVKRLDQYSLLLQATSSGRRRINHKFCYLGIVYTFIVSLVLVYFLPFHIEINVMGKVTDRSYRLRDQNLSVYLQPDKDTFLMDINREVFDLERQLSAHQDITVFVCSDTRNRERRRNIRATWGKALRPKPTFILGLSEVESDNLMAMEEAKIYQDVIVENFYEDYKNLTLKTMFALKHFVRLTPNEKYFLKIDDDVLLNVFNLENVLKKYRDCRGVIGSKEPIRSPQRDKESKWHVPTWMYAKDSFPHFVNGPAYIISGSIVEEIYRKALTTPLVTLEDVFVTGIVAHNGLDYPLFHHPGFRDYPFLHFEKNCYFRSSVTIHRMTDPVEVATAWQKLKENPEPCWDWEH